ncbi:WecB/TagA/CpsF family glycosyltransferase [Paenibacillus sp. RC67]|uniref:WecB/TagA/CpsF family glycosyltransferase n=1 Tax=Paenibacillus sp. RC67 TaxID=3039392 RepID=UPI0024AE8390|nr:WecB/TagA/CpsF family glycosyltransferase [Paenibacillus sp. RC67]
MESYAKIMGIRFPKLTLDGTVETLSDEIEQNKSELFHVIKVNPEITMACQKDSSLRSIVDEAGLITADGIGIVRASRLRGGNLPERITGYDTLLRLLKYGAHCPDENGSYLLGGNLICI